MSLIAWTLRGPYTIAARRFRRALETAFCGRMSAMGYRLISRLFGGGTVTPRGHRMHRFRFLRTDCGGTHCERSRTHHGNMGHGYDGLSNLRGIQQHDSASSSGIDSVLVDFRFPGSQPRYGGLSLRASTLMPAHTLSPASDDANNTKQHCRTCAAAILFRRNKEPWKRGTQPVARWFAVADEISLLFPKIPLQQARNLVFNRQETNSRAFPAGKMARC